MFTRWASGPLTARGRSARQRRVQISEISGSESIVRVDIEGNQWVSEAHGIHSYEFNQHADFFFNADRCLYFDANGNTIGA